jgi:hypothetical protein
MNNPFESKLPKSFHEALDAQMEIGRKFNDSALQKIACLVSWSGTPIEKVAVTPAEKRAEELKLDHFLNL